MNFAHNQPDTMQHLSIVCIGGGTGLHTILPGIRERFPSAKLSAVVSMMDSGGSTGKLRDEFGYLPPGDIRKALVALSDAPQELRALMQHRFTAQGSLQDHVVGNILLTALKDISGGDEYGAIQAMERILRINGSVYPVTLTNCHLVARMENGSLIRGETNIDIPKHNPALRITALALEPKAALFEKTRDAIAHADYILIGPGDLYTSIMPNLIVNGMADALTEAKRRGGRIILITNTMTKNGETNEFAASDFYATIQEALDGAAIDVIIMNNGKINDRQRTAYAQEQAEPVRPDLRSTQNGPLIITGDFVSKKEFARHHPQALAEAIETAIITLNLKERTQAKSGFDDNDNIEEEFV